MRIALTIAAALTAACLVHADGLAAEGFTYGVAEQSAAVQLAAAQNALLQLAVEQEPTQRLSMFGLALTSLTALYQLHGCEWALDPLAEVYAMPDCPESYYGFSSDGRIALRVELLELLNPAFEGYSVYLCQLESNSALHFEEAGSPQVAFVRTEGSTLEPQLLSEAHPLWGNLSRLAPTFSPPGHLYSGAASAFKQLYGVPASGTGDVSQVLFTWSDYSFELTVPRGK